MPAGGNEAITLGELAAALSLDVSQFTPAIQQVKGTIAELMALLKQLGLEAGKTEAVINKAATTELQNYRAMLEAERLYYKARKDRFDSEVNYSNLTKKLRDVEAAQRREQEIATNVGFQQEAEYRAKTLTQQAASRANYTSLVSQLRKQEVAGELAANEEYAAIRKARFAADEVGVLQEVAYNAEKNKAESAQNFERARLSAYFRQQEVKAAAVAAAEQVRIASLAAKEQVAAQAKSQSELAAGAALGGRLAGGWTGAAVARGAFSLSGPIIGSVALAAATYELVKWTKQAEEAAQKTGNFAEELGITWSQARNLEELAKLAGTEIGTLAQASGRLAESLDSGTTAGKSISKALQDIGVSGSSSGELLINFLHALSEIPDQTTRIAKAREVLGRGAAELIPLISNLGTLNEIIAKMGDNGSESANGLTQAALKLNELDLAWNRLKQSFAVTLYPTVTVLVGVLSKTLEAMSDGQKGHPLYGAPPTLKYFKTLENMEDVYKKSGGGAFSKDQVDYMHKMQVERAQDLASEQELAEVKAINHQRGLQQVDEYLKKQEQTLDGLKKHLQAEKDIISERDRALSSKSDILTGEPRIQAAQQMKNAVAERDRLEQQIRAREGKDKINYNSSYDFQARQIDEHRKQLDFERRAAQPLTTRIDDTSSFSGIDATKTRAISAITSALTNQLDDIAGKKDSLIRNGANKTTGTDLDNQGSQAARDAADKIRDVVRKSLEDTQRLKEQFTKEDLENYVHTLNEEKRLQEEFSKAIGRMAIELNNDIRKSQEASLAAKVSHLKSVESLERDHVQYLASQGEISKSEELERLTAIAKAAEYAEHAQLQAEQAKLDATRSSNPNYLTDTADINKRQQILDDARALRVQKEEEDRAKGGPAKQGVSKELADQLAIKDEAGAASDLAVQMAVLKVENDLLTASFQGLGGVLSIVVDDLHKDFDSVGKDLVNAANDHKHFARDITRDAKAMLKTLEGDVAEQLLKLGLGKVISHIPGLGPHKSPQQVATEDNTKATTDNTKWTQDQTLKIQEQMHIEELNSLAVTANTQAIRDLITEMQHCGCKGEEKSSGGGIPLGAIGHGIETAASTIGKFLIGLVHGGGSASDSNVGLANSNNPKGVATSTISYQVQVLSHRGLNGVVGQRGSTSSSTVHQHITLHGHFSSSEIDEIGNKLVKHGRRIGASA